MTALLLLALSGLYFDFDAAVLKPEPAANLPAIVALIRIEAVRTALIALDANLAARLKAEGFGETRPQASNTSLEGRAQNRRVELALP